MNEAEWKTKVCQEESERNEKRIREAIAARDRALAEVALLRNAILEKELDEGGFCLWCSAYREGDENHTDNCLYQQLWTKQEFPIALLSADVLMAAERLEKVARIPGGNDDRILIEESLLRELIGLVRALRAARERERQRENHH